MMAFKIQLWTKLHNPYYNNPPPPKIASCNYYAKNNFNCIPVITIILTAMEVFHAVVYCHNTIFMYAYQYTHKICMHM